MANLFQDEFISKRVLSRITKEIKREQLDKTISEMSYFNELQSQLLSRCDFTEDENRQLDFIKKFNNAKRKSLQA